jgi:hypothetical protein
MVQEGTVDAMLVHPVEVSTCSCQVHTAARVDDGMMQGFPGSQLISVMRNSNAELGGQTIGKTLRLTGHSIKTGLDTS